MLPAGSHPVSKFKLAAFGLITCSLLFVLVEGVLAVLDIPAQDVSQDPFVGFSSQENLFTETLVEKNGKTIPVMVTDPDKLELFPNESFARNKPKRTLRAFCLGGSTTYGRPYTPWTSFCSWVEDFINQADGSHRWEVINAGGVSYASYRIALLMKELIQYEPDLFIVYTGHNEFLEQRTYSKILRLPMVLRDIGTLASRLRIYALLDQLIESVTAKEDKPVSVHALADEVNPILDHSVGPESYQRDDEQKQDVVAHFRYNLVRIIKLARSVGAKTILVAPAPKLRHETPFKSQHRAGLDEPELTKWEESYESAEQLARQKKFEAALSQVRVAEALDPRYAHTFSLKGDILYELGRYPEAKAAYQRAVDEDICPLRAITPLYTAVLETGRKMNVPVLDFEPIISAGSPHGITDESTFLDHVHPTIEGHRILALQLVKEINKSGLIESPRSLTQEGIQRIVEARMSHVDRAAHAEALIDRAMLANWGGKFQEAITLAERARALDPEYVDAYYWFKWVRSYDVDADLGAIGSGSKEEMQAKVDYLLARKTEAENDPYLGNTLIRLEILGRYDVEKPPPERVERAAE